MAACPPYVNPSRTRRIVLSMGIECNPGATRTVGLEQVPLYENFNPLQPEFETITLNRAKPGLGPEGAAAGLGFYRINGTVYAQGSGMGNLPPAWTKFMNISGYTPIRYTPSTAAAFTATGLTNITFTASNGAGNIDDGVYYYKLSRVIPGTGETLLSAASASVTIAGANDSVDIDFAPHATLVDGDIVRIYRTKVGVANTGPYYFVDQTVVDVAVPYQDIADDINLKEPVPNESTLNNETIWTPVAEGHDSATIWSYLDHAKYPASGARGNISFRGDTGKLFEGTADVQGVYNERVVVANPTTLSANPGIPPRICGIDLLITPEGGGARTPIVKNVGVDLGARPTQRLDANNDECLIEIGIFDEFDARFTTQIEVDSTYDYVQEFKENKLYKVEATFGPQTSPTGKRIQFYNEVYGALQVAPPQFDNSNGVRVVNLSFQLTSPTGGQDFLKVRAF